MSELRRAMAAIALVLGVGLIGLVAPAAATTDPDPSEPPPTEVPDTEPEPSDPPATEVPDTEPDGSTAEPVPDDDVDWDAYVVAAVLGFAFLVVVAAWIMVHRRDDDVGPQAEPPSSI